MPLASGTGTPILLTGTVGARASSSVLAFERADRVFHQRPHHDPVTQVYDDDTTCVPTGPRLSWDGDLSVAGDRHHVTGCRHADIV